jgi:colanic acid/amylovoran biosynthesis glycosyltransferase
VLDSDPHTGVTAGAVGWQTQAEENSMPDYPFAVAAKSFDKPSETFIRHHATALMPGRTALLQTEIALADPALVPGPVLTDFARSPGRLSWAKPEQRAADFLKAHGVQTVLAEYGPVGVKVQQAAAAAGARLFVHFHGYDATREVHRTGVIDSYRKLFVQADGVFVPSRYIGARLAALGCPESKLTVAPCGVDPDRFAPSARLPGRLLSVGRLVEKKSPITTLRAFRIARAACPELHLDMVGDGPLFDAATRFVAEAGLEQSVTLHGAQPHDRVRALMAQAQTFLQHSVVATSGDCEGLPVAILEAMSAGLPVIATWHSGIPEAVTHGRHGLLVAEYDVEGMAEAIITLTRDPDLGARMGSEGRARVLSQFTAARTEAILRGAMGLVP